MASARFDLLLNTRFCSPMPDVDFQRDDVSAFGVGLMKRGGPSAGSLVNTVVLCLLLGAAYLLLGQFAFSMAVRDANITCQAFFPEGVSLVCIILFGPRVAPGIFLGQLVLAQWTGLPFGASAVIALVNTLEGILGGYLFWRWRISPLLSRPRDIGMLLALCALVLQPLSATGGIMAKYLLAGPVSGNPGSLWLYWWAGNVLGQMLVVPLVLTWVCNPAPRDRSETRHALLVVGIYFVPVAIFIFGDWGANGPLYRLMVFAAFYLPLIWLAVQSRVRTVALANLLLTAPFLFLINAGPDHTLFFSNQNRHLGADIVIVAGIVTALLISALWEQLMDRKEQLREANIAREKLFSMIGHDLRGPVASVKSSLDLLCDGRLGAAEFRDFQDHLRVGVNHVHVTLENMIGWGSQNSLQPRFEKVDLAATAQEAMGLLLLTASEKKITVDNEIPEEAGVHADKYQIQSVMRNLLSNALKFTPERGRVVFSARRQDCFWRVSVEDNGVGMPAERAAHLLDADSEYISTLGTANERGLGLGLQLCRDFIRANSGTLSVESAEGKGTTFHILLPASSKMSVKLAREAV